jgi:shikimate 5-dehydrogenase
MIISTSYAVIGHPVSHSLSPRIHAAFARQTGVAMDYRAIDAEDFESALQTFADAGGVGANVTLPHKHRAAALCSGLSDRARRAGAVNTLMRVDSNATGCSWHGDNTDGAGLVRDLTGRNSLDLRGRRTLLLGAGGGAHGVAPGLLDAGIADLSYGEASIAFLAWARAAGCRDAIDGLGMLVEQAAESFALWHGVRPETDAIYAELRAHDVELISAD